jgi:hypothetical protein
LPATLEAGLILSKKRMKSYNLIRLPTDSYEKPVFTW